jgi:hypothetical protein
VNPSDVLAKLIAEQHCAITAATPENERLRRVRDPLQHKSAKAKRRAANQVRYPVSVTKAIARQLLA